MIFGNQNSNQGDAAEPSGAPAAGSFLVGGTTTDPATTGTPLPADLDDDTTTSGALDQPVATDATDTADVSDAVPTEEASAPDHEQSEFSSIIAPADRDIPAVVHASVKSSLINQTNPYDDDTSTEGTPHEPVDLPDDLLDLKQQALTDLGPLVDHLDQTPEEKFRTTMMLIQSTDNSALIKDAYAAAQAINDDKIRAQALLDVINEINYFTQQPSDAQE